MSAMPELVCSTADRNAWLTARRSGVTATDIVTIMGLSHYDSPYSLYWRKLGQVPETPDNDRFALGRYLEPYVEARWVDDSRRAIHKAGQLYRSTARPWQMATPDALEWAIGIGLEPSVPVAVVEFKTWADADKTSWSDEPPPAVRAQVLWQMDVMDVATGHVGVVFLPSGEFRSYAIEHEGICDWDNARLPTMTCLVCADIKAMRAAGLDFYRRLQDNDPPDPDASAATLAAVKARLVKREGKRGTVDKSEWRDWTHLKDERDQLDESIRLHESRIREQLGEADEIEVDGQLVGRRIVTTAHVKAHDRTQDYIKRTKGTTNGS